MLPAADRTVQATGNERLATTMKLISLNIWGGNAYDAFMSFVREHAADTDIFCFQEVFRSDSGVAVSRGTHINILSDITAALPGFRGFFQPMQENIDIKGAIDIADEFGLATFVRPPLAVEKEGFLPVFREPGSMEGNDFETLPHILQYARLARSGAPFTVAHVHGMSRPGTKLDTEDRIEQSRRIVSFLAGEPGPKILCGDFNLMPETESIAMIERGSPPSQELRRASMRNLIRDFGITDTRGALSHAKWPDSHQYFADYTFVSADVKVKSFEVPQVPVSDHLPMVLEFEVISE